MFRRTRDDTRVDTIEGRYGINLNARGDAHIGNLIEDRGFDSLSQLLKAYHGNATDFACKRRLFLCFHAEDRPRVQGFRLMAVNPSLSFDFVDDSVRVPIDSENASYVKQIIRAKINRASVLVCLIGNGTRFREWVDWELQVGYDLGKGLCGVRLKESRGGAPQILRDLGCPVAAWDIDEIVAAIECAAARRS